MDYYLIAGWTSRVITTRAPPCTNTWSWAFWWDDSHRNRPRQVRNPMMSWECFGTRLGDDEGDSPKMKWRLPEWFNGNSSHNASVENMALDEFRLFLTKNEGYATCPTHLGCFPVSDTCFQGFWQASLQLLSVHTPERIDPDFQKTTKNQQRATSSDHAKPYHALSLQASYPGRRNMEPRLNVRDR